MSSSSEDEEASEESSYQSEFSDDGERTSDQEETDQEEDDRSPCTEKRGQDEGERKVTLRSKQERKRTKKRKDRISDQEETDSREEGRLSHDIKLETHKKVGELEEGLMTLGDREETRGKRKKVEGGREDELTETVAGIVYLSRVPPFMKPHKVKHLLSCYGSVGRVYLKPEDPLVRQRRIKFKGNKKKNFTEGWVEFHDKRIAKTVALMLNNTPIGGKKRSYYHDDLWNIKYLSKFRWTHLTERIAYEQAVREQKMRTEISQAKRENTHYLASVEKGKEIDAIVQRKRKRGATEEEVTKLQRRYKQRRVTEATKPQTREAHSAEKSQLRVSSDVTSKIHLSDSLLKKILPG